jgi:hypothetical protein
MKLASFLQERSFTITAGSKELASGTLGTEARIFDLQWQVPKGFSTVLVTAGGQPVAPASVGIGNDLRPLVVNLSECSYSTK